MPSRSSRFEPPDLPPVGAPGGTGGRITALLRSANAPGELTIKLGRRTAGTIDENLAADLGMAEGVIWTERMRSAVAGAMMLAEARDWGARAVSRRAMSRVMLITKLRQRGLDSGPAARIAEELAAAGMIDEKRFAENVAEVALARRTHGTRRVALKLRAKGIDFRTAAQTVDRIAAESGYDARAVATDLARRKLRSLARKPDPDARQRALYSLLARRGFDSDLCRDVVRQVLSE